MDFQLMYTGNVLNETHQSEIFELRHNELAISSATRLSALVAALPEVYQPIYGHPEFSDRVSRESADRMAKIHDVYNAMSTALGRPLRVLDLGCAQGYMCFSLAELGAEVTGVELLPANIAVCDALKQEHEHFSVEFISTSLESFCNDLQPNYYDLVLGLNIFHHLILQYGQEQITAFLAQIGSKAKVWIFEFALASEPVHWAKAQPDDVLKLLASYPFVIELGRCQTHLSSIARPLLFASHSYWYLNGNVQEFTTWRSQSHQYAEDFFEGSRRYFFNDTYFVKCFSLSGPYAKINQTEIQREVSFLTDQRTFSNKYPQLIGSGLAANQTWLMRELLPGKLLLAKLEQNEPTDPEQIIGDILADLVALEEQGLYHGDLRLWNIVLSDDGRASLIDYGAILSTARDCSWPENIFVGFWTFVYGLTQNREIHGIIRQAPFISPFNLPERYQQWALSVWNQPPSVWSFRLLLQEFQAHVSPSSKPYSMNATELWMREIEQFLHRMSEQNAMISETLIQASRLQVEQNRLIKALINEKS